MKNLEKYLPTLNLDGVELKPITKILLLTKNGVEIEIDTPLTIQDFYSIWNKRVKTIKIVTGLNSYAYINKKNIDFYQVYPITD